MANYELWLTDQDGNRIELLDNVLSFQMSRGYGKIGVINASFPYLANRQYTRPIPDRRIHVWRNGRFFGAYFLRQFIDGLDSGGQSTMTLRGLDGNDLLNRRLVSYPSTEAASESNMTGNVDNIMKEIVRDNLGGDAIAARDLTSLGFSIDANTSLGPSTSSAFAWQNVLTTLQKLQDASYALGNEVYFWVEATSPTTFVFKTAVGQPGADLTNKFTFGPDFGNVSSIELDYDYTKEINYAYAGGRGIGNERDVQESSDTTRINASKWNRREGIVQATSLAQGDSNFVQNKADELLGSGKPVIRVSASIQSTPSTPFGNGWNFGDKVRISYHGLQIDTVIVAGVITVGGKKETITASVEGEIS